MNRIALSLAIAFFSLFASISAFAQDQQNPIVRVGAEISALKRKISGLSARVNRGDKAATAKAAELEKRIQELEDKQSSDCMAALPLLKEDKELAQVLVTSCAKIWSNVTSTDVIPPELGLYLQGIAPKKVDKTYDGNGNLMKEDIEYVPSPAVQNLGTAVESGGFGGGCRKVSFVAPATKAGEGFARSASFLEVEENCGGNNLPPVVLADEDTSLAEHIIWGGVLYGGSYIAGFAFGGLLWPSSIEEDAGEVTFDAGGANKVGLVAGGLALGGYVIYVLSSDGADNKAKQPTKYQGWGSSLIPPTNENPYAGSSSGGPLWFSFDGSW